MVDSALASRPAQRRALARVDVERARARASVFALLRVRDGQFLEGQRPGRLRRDLPRPHPRLSAPADRSGPAGRAARPELRAIAERALLARARGRASQRARAALREALREREQVERRTGRRARARAGAERRSEPLVRRASRSRSRSIISSTLRRVAELVVPEMADGCTVAVRGESGRLERAAVVHRDERLARIALEYEAPLSARRAIAPAISSSTLLRGRGGAAPPGHRRGVTGRRPQDPRHLEDPARARPQLRIMVPEVLHGKTLGVISLMLSGLVAPFDDDDLKIAEELARRAAVASTTRASIAKRGRREEEKLRQSELRLRAARREHQGLRDLHARSANGHVATWNPGARAHQGLHGRRDHRPPLLDLLSRRGRAAPASASSSCGSRRRPAASRTTAGACARTARASGRTSSSARCATSAASSSASPRSRAI